MNHNVTGNGEREGYKNHMNWIISSEAPTGIPKVNVQRPSKPEEEFTLKGSRVGYQVLIMDSRSGGDGILPL